MNFLTANSKRLILFAGDIIILYLTLALTLFIRQGLNWEEIEFSAQNPHFMPFTIIYMLWLLVFYISGLYDLSLARNNLKFFSTLFKAMAISSGLAVAFFYFIPYYGITPKTVLFINIAVFSLLMGLWRQLYNRLILAPTLRNNLLIIGETPEITELMKKIKENPQLGYRIKRFVDHKEIEVMHDLVEYLVKDNIQTIVTAINPRKDGGLVKNLYNCLPLNIALFDLPAFYERITGKIPISAIEEIWFLENMMCGSKGLYETAKRITDIIYAAILLIVSLPFFPLIALAIKLDSSGPLFYKQKRVGEGSKIFNVYKFRSMVRDAEKNGAQWAQTNDSRVTKVGKFLRLTRIDEIPQLYNILKGDMSFIGPRPERPEFVFGTNLQRQIPFYQIRHLIKPGLTGWAQINFQYGASLEDSIEKLQYDLFYIKNRSFFLDLQITLKTIKTILSAAGR